MAIKKAKAGEEVQLTFKLGKLTLSNGSIEFTSEKLSNASQPTSARTYPISHSQVGSRSPDQASELYAAVSPTRALAAPQSALASPLRNILAE